VIVWCIKKTDESNFELQTSNLGLFEATEFNHRVTKSTEPACRTGRVHKEKKAIPFVFFVLSVAPW